MSKRAVLGVILKRVLELLVSLLNVDAHANSDKQKSTSDNQDNDKRATLGLLFGLEGLGRNNGVSRLGNNLSVISIETNSVIGEVQHHIVAAEESVSDEVSLLLGSILPVHEELASILGHRLVVGINIRKLNINSVVLFLKRQNVLSVVLVSLLITLSSIEVEEDILNVAADATA